LNSRALAFTAAALAFVACLLAQPLLIGHPPAVIIPGLADFRPAWNRGVSFSLFSQDSDTGRYVLMAVTAVISAGVAWAAWRASSRLEAVGYGVVLGGALGNLADRARFHAVFDFLSLHLGGLPLFICNLPDIAISAGVLLLLADAVWPARVNVEGTDPSPPHAR
jgi:signal peptidase II